MEAFASAGYGNLAGLRTRDRILDASLRMFAANGYTETTVRDIAGECGISDAAIFHHFTGKAEILQALISQGIELPLRHRDAAAGAGETLASRIVDEALLIIDSNRDLLRVVMREALAGDVRARRRYDDWLGFWEGRLEPVIESSCETGRASDLARQVLLLIVMAVEDALLLRRDDRLSTVERRNSLRMFLVGAVSRILSPG